MAHNRASLPDGSDINPTSRADPSKLNALNFVFLRVEFCFFARGFFKTSSGGNGSGNNFWASGEEYLAAISNGRNPFWGTFRGRPSREFGPCRTALHQASLYNKLAKLLTTKTYARLVGL